MVWKLMIVFISFFPMLLHVTQAYDNCGNGYYCDEGSCCGGNRCCMWWNWVLLGIGVLTIIFGICFCISRRNQSKQPGAVIVGPRTAHPPPFQPQNFQPMPTRDEPMPSSQPPVYQYPINSGYQPNRNEPMPTSQPPVYQYPINSGYQPNRNEGPALYPIVTSTSWNPDYQQERGGDMELKQRNQP